MTRETATADVHIDEVLNWRGHGWTETDTTPDVTIAEMVILDDEQADAKPAKGEAAKETNAKPIPALTKPKKAKSK